MLLLLLLFTFSACGSKQEEAPEGPTPISTNLPEASGTDALKEQTEGPFSLDAIADLLNGAVLPEYPIGEITLPEDSAVYDRSLALQTLALCSGRTAEQEAELFRRAGLALLLQKNYDKESSDLSHTCAYTVGSSFVTLRGEKRTLIVAAIRGTEAGEWYSNFDFSPSHSENTVFAENFLFAAEDVFAGLNGILAATDRPLILVCGYSRGAACANLLGMLLNASVGKDCVYVYTFATPATVRTDDVGVVCDNLFNHINTGDLVPAVPLASWSYRRLGSDILLGGDDESVERRDCVVDALSAVAPSVSAYYCDRHAPDRAGLSENGITAFELMLAVSRNILSSPAADDSGPSLGEMGAFLSPDSDLYPLYELLRKGAEEEGAGFAAVLRQHLPSVYFGLLTAETQKN